MPPSEPQGDPAETSGIRIPPPLFYVAGFLIGRRPRSPSPAPWSDSVPGSTWTAQVCDRFTRNPMYLGMACA